MSPVAMHRFKRIAISLIACLLLTALVVAGCVYLLLATETGTRWTLARIDTALSGHLETNDLDGTLWYGLRIAELHYRDETTDVRAGELFVDIGWLSVLSGTVDIEELIVNEVAYRNLRPPIAPAQPFELALAPLPIDVAVNHIRVARLLLLRDNAQSEITDLMLRNAYVTGNRVRIEHVGASASTVDVALADIDGQIDEDVPINANISWNASPQGWSGGGTVGGTLAALTFEQSVTGPYPADISGILFVLGRVTPEFDAALSWSIWSFDRVGFQDGAANVRGTMERYAIEFDTTALLPVGDTAEVTGRADGNVNGLPNFDVEFTSMSGNGAASGSLDWRPTFSLNAIVRAADFDPSVLVAELPGELNAEAALNIEAGGLLKFSDVAVNGLLNDLPLTATGSGSISPSALECMDCRIELGENRISFNGTQIDDGIELSLSIDAPSVQQLWPAAAGSLEGSVAIGGTMPEPRLSGELSGRNLAFATWSVAEATLISRESTIDNADFAVSGTNIARGEDEFGTIAVTGLGAADNIDVDLDWTVRGFVINAAVNLARADQGVSGAVRAATIADARTGTWTLREAFTFSAVSDDINVAAHRWQNGAGELLIDTASRQADTVRLLAGLEGFPLRTFDAWLPETLNIAGTASAAIDLTYENSAWVGSVDWLQNDTVLSIAARDQEKIDLAIPVVSANAILGSGGVDASATLQIETDISGDLRLRADGLDENSAIDANLNLDGGDWSWIPHLLPGIDSFDGAISARVAANGTFASPDFSGTIEWQAGSLALPALNVPVTEIELSLDGAVNGAATVSGSARAGDGDLRVTGRFENLMQPDRSLELTVHGDGAELINWPDYRVWASPDLRVSGSAQGWMFSGAVDIPQADINVHELPDDAVLISEDVAVIGREEQNEATSRVSGESQLTLGDQVRVRAFGLDTGLRGDLRLRIPPGREMLADGTVDLVDGVFSAYGQKLTITDGTLTFTGPLDDPLVDVRAVRVVETFDGKITAGINVRGRGRNLTSTVFSEPVMPEADALSYLVIGRPLSQASQTEGGELSGAAIALGVRQAARITEQLGQAFGLDQLALTGNGNDATALVAGKQINSRLHARYAYGVFSRLGTLLLRYRLSQRLTLEAGAGEDQSIDLLYQVEKQ